ncbi:MAG: Beta-lactamase domain-containing protein [Candidatus Tokpelaia hoelldobleri]|uniref:Beta-lactamase domain-containing protein n=1 Tax=Candidatus Tokpelaia hoelldobleri TaxID=1902579 RepID=A0A1U9JTA3_9HYPH|nr:MAG: Beta-lactamase domain-containing protein [Candidatus Tokpelaia hoelldoblerii]
MALVFDKDFTPPYGEPVTLQPDVVRITAPNTGVLTFTGTNTYLVGRQTLVILDPGPDDESHFAAVMAATGGRPVSHIVLTHAHQDHAALAQRMAAYFNAPVAAAENSPYNIIHGMNAAPGLFLADGAAIPLGDMVLTAIATPGHTADHFVFALATGNRPTDDGRSNTCLFSGDHVMAWAPTMIAPPEGVMQDYMASLDKLLKRQETLYYPGHGGVLYEAHKFVRALKVHRKMRERAILERIIKRDTTIDTIVQAIYPEMPEQLREAAALSVFAHLENLTARGLVTPQSAHPDRDSRYLLVGIRR